MHSDCKYRVKPFLHEMLTLEFQWPKWEEVIVITRELGIENLVRDIVLQGLSQE